MKDNKEDMLRKKLSKNKTKLIIKNNQIIIKDKRKKPIITVKENGAKRIIIIINQKRENVGSNSLLKANKSKLNTYKKYQK